MSVARAIKDLEKHGYSVMPPRDRQGEWQLSVARLLEMFQITVRNPYERGDVDMKGMSRTSLTTIRDEITEMLERDG